MNQHDKVRLGKDLVDLILDYVESVDPHAHVYVFGSRADLSKKGGDIDLLILSEIFSFLHRRTLIFKMEDLIGEQKIDIVFGKDTSDSFVQHILKKAVKL